MILHVAKLEKFIPPFIDFVAENFDMSRHQFWIKGNSERFPYTQHTGIYNRNDSLLRNLLAPFFFIYYMHIADKVILHSLSGRAIVRTLYFMPWLLKKCYWVIWGGDLYAYLQNKPGRWRIKEVFRRRVIKNMGHLVTYVKGDMELARQWYGATGQYHECLMYLSNIYKEYEVPPKANATLNIQIGNSADPSNNHEQIFELLAPIKDQNVALYIPLSYGKKAYAKKIKEKGESIFGDKLHAMTDFLPFQDYLKFLGGIDIAIFNHKRQQAMGNIITLLGLGKTVYMRDDITSWQTLQELGITVYPIRGDLSHKVSASATLRNREIVKYYFSESNLKNQLRKIFEVS